MYFIMLNMPVILLWQLVSGSMGEDGLCHCVVHLTNDLIPLKELDQLQSTVERLMDKYDQFSKVSAGAAGWGWELHEHILSYIQNEDELG